MDHDGGAEETLEGAVEQRILYPRTQRVVSAMRKYMRNIYYALH